MKIMVPLVKDCAVLDLVEAGADEFYFGFFDKRWERSFGTFSEINRMSSFGTRANYAVSEINELVKCIHANGKKAFVTLNSAYYTNQQLPYVYEYIDMLCDMCVDGIILGDCLLIEEVKKRGGVPVLSTMAGVYNSLILDFYADMGVDRILLPRDISINNIKQIVKNRSDVQFEVFLMRNGCKYSDSQCSMYHGRGFGSMCFCLDHLENKMIFDEPVSDIRKQNFERKNIAYRTKYHREACGICCLKFFYEIGVSSVKIVGRNDEMNSVINDVKCVRKYMDMIEAGEEFIVEKTGKCFENYNCYYSMDEKACK